MLSREEGGLGWGGEGSRPTAAIRGGRKPGNTSSKGGRWSWLAINFTSMADLIKKCEF